MTIETLNTENMFGYTQITTSFEDFSIAEHFGKNAIVDTFNRLHEEFKDSYKELTELVMVLNWKLWIFYERHNEDLAQLYNDLWEKEDGFACDNLKGDELSYFYRTTD